MDKLNNSKRAIKGTITKIETFVEESGNHTPTKLDIKLKRVQEMNRKIDELKDQYYDIKHISESELQVIEADIQSMEDRLKELESQKLYYLKASLQGDAKLLEAVDNSFESLITALKTRFENKRLLTETHINAILEIEKLTSESARDIRTMTDILSKNIRALKLLGFECNNLSDLILFNIILKKIDRETRKQFEQSIDSNQIPELDTFIMFLEKRSQTIDSINRSAPITHKPKQVPFHKGIEVKVGITFQDGDRFNSCQVIYSQFGLAIHQNDYQARRRFVEWAQNEIAVVPNFHKRILFSDEAHFWLNGYVNKQNCRIWSEANPQVYVETPLHPEKLIVWCALWAGGILLQKR
ncbi:DUF1758 domain-containing protein [Trichonephila clavipes]|nr:DUF1758 domain-containing protein [Trichonephila clavipes]